MDFDLIERLAHLSERTLPVQALKTMQVRVKVPDLIDTIRKNREAHLLIYGQAKAKYIEQAIAAVELVSPLPIIQNELFYLIRLQVIHGQVCRQQ